MLSTEELCERLANCGDQPPSMPERLSWCAQAGVFRWFVPREYGGWQWSEQQQLEGYLDLSRACLTTAFVLTQWNAACKRIVLSENQTLRWRWLPAMASGAVLATVGISHLTTSRQHLQRPVLEATPQPDGSWILEGYSPWVTAGALSDVIVVGASLADGRQILCAVPTNRVGVKTGPGLPLVALSASATDQVRFERVSVQADELLAGPVENVMHSGVGGGAGGVQTSTLAIGLTLAAVEFLQSEAAGRSDLRAVADKLAADAQGLKARLFQLADELSRPPCSPSDSAQGERTTAGKLREQANSLVLRATQAALGAAKGAGFVDDHPVGRWCKEALFFLVWSCPQPVLAANLCEFAQV